ncbi:MAG: helix-turn-helix domain-containing protein [Oscillospiraceae bacterium]|nr:helix-turn-helix domain-containing protein [Oscillospiraceae bacterium]
MSGRIFQGVIVQLKEATERTIGVVDAAGVVVAAGELSLIGTRPEDVVFPKGEDSVFTTVGRTYKVLDGFPENAYAVFADGADETARTICLLASVAIREARICYEEKHDKVGFLKHILSENTLVDDIAIRAQELQFPLNASRAVFVIRRAEQSEASMAEVLREMFPNEERDFLVPMGTHDLVLIKEVEPDTSSAILLALAGVIESSLSSEELAIQTVIGIGTLARSLKELAERYKEAQAAIEVGKVFETEKAIVHYDHLGIGRLIYQLPVTLCEMFLAEVFEKNPIDALDPETLYTINRFFENSLNVSETSRKLFVHRNTLVYRLEKIKKLTGLDLREFDHAIVFKVALMVKKYLNAQAAK